MNAPLRNRSTRPFRRPSRFIGTAILTVGAFLLTGSLFFFLLLAPSFRLPKSDMIQSWADVCHNSGPGLGRGPCFVVSHLDVFASLPIAFAMVIMAIGWGLRGQAPVTDRGLRIALWLTTVASIVTLLALLTPLSALVVSPLLWLLGPLGATTAALRILLRVATVLAILGCLRWLQVKPALSPPSPGKPQQPTGSVGC